MRYLSAMGLPENQEVCVTGGTGYIASFLVRKLLEKGYRVRTTVRHSGFKTSQLILRTRQS